MGLVATICGFVGTIVVSLYSTLPISSITVYPAWLHLLLSLCYFLYQTLDNIDGKQARRTGTSSSLGYVFDHGCDAINSTIGTSMSSDKVKQVIKDQMDFWSFFENELKDRENRNYKEDQNTCT